MYSAKRESSVQFWVKETKTMTFEEAKQRSDYNFALNGIENDIEDIRNNYMKGLHENGDPERGIAILKSVM